ncbi:hypothetical protein ACSBR2_023067 [Camellia fascicularis]
MVSSGHSRRSFIEPSIEVAKKFGFDVVDLDWESPQNPKEMKILGLLHHEWRAKVHKGSKAMGQTPLLLTAAMYFSVDFFTFDVQCSYPVGKLGPGHGFPMLDLAFIIYVTQLWFINFCLPL